MRDKKPVIYCLEGVFRDDDDPVDLRSSDATVEPILQYLKQNDYWDYRYRDVATTAELAYYLDKEWALCRVGSILYLSTHAGPGCITLSSGNDVYVTADLKRASRSEEDDLTWLLSGWSQENCHIHFGGCAVMANADEWVEDFLENTGAAVVSGFKQDNIGWSDLEIPGVLAEAMLFSALSDVNYGDGRNYKKRLLKIKSRMDDRFDDCDFSIKQDSRTTLLPIRYFGRNPCPISVLAPAHSREFSVAVPWLY